MSAFSVQAAATAQLTTRRTCLLGIWYVGGATAGTLVFKDGGSGGTARLTINTPGITASGNTPADYIDLSGAGGIEFLTDMYVAVTTTAFLTAIYRQDG